MTAVEVEIRGFVDDDGPALVDVFDRAGDGAPTSSLWGDAESEAAIYLMPYIDLENGALLVALVDGSIVGYLAGCDNDVRFPSESERIDRAIRQHRLWARPRAIAFFMRAMFDVAGAKLRRASTAGDFADPRWPAHLHINVIPEARWTGVAPALMQRCWPTWPTRRLRAATCKPSSRILGQLPSSSRWGSPDSSRHPWCRGCGTSGDESTNSR